MRLDRCRFFLVVKSADFLEVSGAGEKERGGSGQAAQSTDVILSGRSKFYSIRNDPSPSGGRKAEYSMTMPKSQ